MKIKFKNKNIELIIEDNWYNAIDSWEFRNIMLIIQNKLIEQEKKR